MERMGYVVEVSVRSHPDNFRGSSFLRKMLSSASERPGWQIGAIGMLISMEEAEQIAQEETNQEGYTPTNGKLMTSKGAVKKISDSSHYL